MSKNLIVMALESESAGQVESTGHEVLYCGVGKVNAAMALTHRLSRGGPVARVINLGSAGSHVHAAKTLIAADRFVQRDMDATGLGFAFGQTPYDATPAMLRFEPYFSALPHGICGSGDSFAQERPRIPCDMVDMEAFALARVCHALKVPFACAKFITDGADGKAHGDWKDNIRHAAQAFAQLLQSVA